MVGVVARLQLQALVQYRQDPASANHRTSCLAEEAQGPLVRRHLLEVEVDLGAHLAAWASVLAERTVQADLQLGRPFGQLAHQQPNFASHP